MTAFTFFCGGYLLCALGFSFMVLWACRRELPYGTILNGLHWHVAFLMGLGWPIFLFYAWNERKS